MSFSRSKRFTQADGEAPPVGSYDPIVKESVICAVNLEQQEDRFKTTSVTGSDAGLTVGDGSSVDFNSFAAAPMMPLPARRLPASLKKVKPRKPCRLDKMYVNGLEKEVNKLNNECTEMDKKLRDREFFINNLESRVKNTTHDKTLLAAKLAATEKRMKDLDKANAVLKQQSKRWWHYFTESE